MGGTTDTPPLNPEEYFKNLEKAATVLKRKKRNKKLDNILNEQNSNKNSNSLLIKIKNKIKSWKKQ